MNQLNADAVKAQIAGLLTAHPELREDNETLVLSLESETDATALCEKLVHKIKVTEALSNGISGYITDLKGRMEDLDRRAGKLRGLLAEIMQNAGVRSLPLAPATLVLQSHRHVIVTDRDKIQEEFRRQPPWEQHKNLIKAKLQSGSLVPGCVLSNPEPSLAIRTR